MNDENWSTQDKIIVKNVTTYPQKVLLQLSRVAPFTNMV